MKGIIAEKFYPLFFLQNKLAFPLELDNMLASLPKELCTWQYYTLLILVMLINILANILFGSENECK